MTLQDMMDAVRLIGAENSLESIDETALPNFYSALNRAVITVNRIEPKRGSVSVNNKTKTASPSISVTESDTSVLYDFSSLTDFERFRGVPYREWGVPCNEGSDFRYVDGAKLSLPMTEETYLVDYDKRIPRFTVDSELTTEIPFDSELTELVVLLTAYFVFSIDTASQNLCSRLKAQYDEEYNRTYYSRRTSHASTVATNNW